MSKNTGSSGCDSQLSSSSTVYRVSMPDTLKEVATIEAGVRLSEWAAGTTLGLRPRHRPQAIRPSERHALRGRQGLRLSGSGQERHTLRPLRHANGPRAADTNRSGILERCWNLGRRSQDRPFQVPERCAGDDLHAGRPGTVGHRSPPWHVPARFPLAGRASSLPRPLEPHGPLRPPAVRPREQTSDTDSARRAGREDDRPSN